MKFTERHDGDWLVVEFIPSFIEAATNIQFGSPTIVGTRIPTYTAAGAWWNKEWDAYGSLTELQAFACACFEAGIEYHRNRKLRKRIDEACSHGWELHHLKETMAKADDATQPEAMGEIDGQV